MSLWSRRVVAIWLSLSFSLSLSYVVSLAFQEMFCSMGMFSSHASVNLLPV